MVRMVPAAPHDGDTCSTWLANGLDRAASRAEAGAGLAPGAAGGPIEGADALFRLTRAGDIDRARALCDQHAATAATGRRAVYADLVLPVVRAIEAEWAAGTAPFDDIIAHFWAVQRLIDGLAGAPAQAAPSPPRGAVLLACPEAEDHGFGLAVVAEEFRAAGWRVAADRGNRRIVDRVGDDLVDAVGLSVGHDAALHGLADLVQDLRIASRNPRLRVILGGHVVAAAPAGFAFLGADLVARTGAEALAWLDRSARPRADALRGHA